MAAQLKIGHLLKSWASLIKQLLYPPARTFITRKILAAKSFSDAEKILRDEGLGIANGFSLNMIWSDAWGSSKMYNVEVAPDMKTDRSQLHVQRYEKDPLVHCNMWDLVLPLFSSISCKSVFEWPMIVYRILKHCYSVKARKDLKSSTLNAQCE